MTSSRPPTAHLAPVEAYALARQLQALRQRPLSIDTMLSGCSHYEERVEIDEGDTVRPGKVFAA